MQPPAIMNDMENNTPDLPKYHETFIPILDVLRDGQPMHYNELRKRVRDKYFGHLPIEQLEATTKDGDPIILNRAGWGKAYLKQAGYVTQPARAMVQITDKGRAALERGSLSLQELKQDEQFLAHRQQVKDRNDTAAPTSAGTSDEQTPQDMIDAGVQAIEDDTKSDLLDKLKMTDPFYFERVVNELFEKMGYGGARTTIKTGDGGIDGVINQDELGLEKIYVQAKRYNGHNVHEPDIRNFIGAMSGDTQKGIFVTTSSFDQRAIDKAREAHHKIILIDGKKLVDLLYKFDVGVQMANKYVLKEIDEDYFI